MNLDVKFVEDNATFNTNFGESSEKIDANFGEVVVIGSANNIRLAEVELHADKWSSNENLHSQVVSIEGVTKNTQVDLTPTVEQLASFYYKDMALVAVNEGGVVTVYVIGQRPLNDYVMQVTLTEVS